MIIDLVRKNDWMPRNFRKQNKEIEDARNKLGLSLDGRQAMRRLPIIWV